MPLISLLYLSYNPLFFLINVRLAGWPGCVWISRLAKNILTLTQQVVYALVSFTLAPGEAPRSPSPGAYVCNPAPFRGNLDRCRGFLLQCRLVVQHCPGSYTTNAAKVSYLLGLLMGRALDWAKALNVRQPLYTITCQELEELLRRCLTGQALQPTLQHGCFASSRVPVQWPNSQGNSGHWL